MVIGTTDPLISAALLGQVESLTVRWIPSGDARADALAEQLGARLVDGSFLSDSLQPMVRDEMLLEQEAKGQQRAGPALQAEALRVLSEAAEMALAPLRSAAARIHPKAASLLVKNEVARALVRRRLRVVENDVEKGHHPRIQSNNNNNISQNTRLRGQQASGLPSAPLRVVIFYTEEPFTIEVPDAVGNDRFSGYLVDVWRTAAAHANLSYTLEWWPRELPLNSLEEVFTAVGNGTYDVGIGDLAVTPDRAARVSFSQPFQTSGYLVATRVNPPNRVAAFAVFHPLSGTVWLSLAGFFVFGTFVLLVIEREALLKGGYTKGVMDAFFFAFNTAWVPGFSDLNLTRAWSRFFMFFWFAGLFVILTAYQANLVSFLTASRVDKSVGSIDDLVNKKTSVWDDGLQQASPANYLRRLGYRELLSVYTTEEGLQVVLNYTVEAHVDYGPYIQYQVDGSCGVKIVGLEFSKSDWAFAVSPPLQTVVDRINTGVLAMIDSRGIQNVREKWLTPPEQQCKIDDRNADNHPPTPVLDIYIFMPVFVIWFGSGALAVVCYAIQIRYFKKNLTPGTIGIIGTTASRRMKQTNNGMGQTNNGMKQTNNVLHRQGQSELEDHEQNQQQAKQQRPPLHHTKQTGRYEDAVKK